MRRRSKELGCWLEGNQKEEDTVEKGGGTRISGKKKNVVRSCFLSCCSEFLLLGTGVFKGCIIGKGRFLLVLSSCFCLNQDRQIYMP